MKKTLTILLSLVGVTVAEASIQELFTLTDASETALNIPGEDAGTLDCSWTFVLTLDPAELAKITDSRNHTPIFKLTFDTEDKGSVSTGVGYFAAGGGYNAQFVPTTDDGYISGATGALTKGFSWDDVSGAALTLVVGTDKTKSRTIPVSIYQYITMNDGTVLRTVLGYETDLENKPNLGEYHSVNFGTFTQTSLGSVSITSDAVQSAACYYGVATGEEVATLTKQAATGVVPEPTTATLSLLALAGLAARRRRK